MARLKKVEQEKQQKLSDYTELEKASSEVKKSVIKLKNIVNKKW